MLSKSQAKMFFLGGTALFSIAFLALTVDTMGQVPARSHESELSESAIRGKTIFDKNNCMGCHTILGEGAYYAPELTTVVERRGKEWMRLFLRDPEAMFPGQRKMVNYHFTEAQIDDVIAFFAWIGKIDTNGFPPKPDIALAGPSLAPNAAALAASGSRFASAPATFKTVCIACHSVDGRGGNVGPPLDDVTGRYTPEQLDAWLSNPTSVKPGTAMPNLNLSPEVRAELVHWLLTSSSKVTP